MLLGKTEMAGEVPFWWVMVGTGTERFGCVQISMESENRWRILGVGEAHRTVL